MCLSSCKAFDFQTPHSLGLSSKLGVKAFTSRVLLLNSREMPQTGIKFILVISLQKKIRIMARLDGTQRSLALRPSHNLVILER